MHVKIFRSTSSSFVFYISFAVAYFATGKLLTNFAFQSQVIPIWLPAGIALVGCFIWQYARTSTANRLRRRATRHDWRCSFKVLARPSAVFKTTPIDYLFYFYRRYCRQPHIGQYWSLCFKSI